MSLTVRLITPCVLIPPQPSPTNGPLGTKPRLGFKPNKPQQDDGTRIEPPPSLPCAKGTTRAATIAAAPPLESVAPKENLLVTFRGDAFHQVRSYRTKTGSERVSLVLEQYKIDEDVYPKTVKFVEAHKSNMTMM